MIPAVFDYQAPTTIDEALSLLAANPDEAKILAGGHSLIPAMKLRLAQPVPPVLKARQVLLVRPVPLARQGQPVRQDLRVRQGLRVPGVRRGLRVRRPRRRPRPCKPASWWPSCPRAPFPAAGSSSSRCSAAATAQRGWRR